MPYLGIPRHKLPKISMLLNKWETSAQVKGFFKIKPWPMPGKSWKRCKRRLRTFCRKSSYFADFLSQISRYVDWGWRKKNWTWSIEVGARIFEVGGWRRKHLELKIEDGWLWMEDRPSRFKDFIMPHQHLIHLFLFIHCRESSFFEDIVKLWIFRLRTIYNFFQVWHKVPKI